MRTYKAGSRLAAVKMLTACFILFSSFKTPPNPPVSFSFTLSSALKTSAGVYSTDGVLIKTLWSGVVYGAGTHTGTWDGTDNEGLLAGSGTYHVKVISSNVNYVWEGTIGNNSLADTGRTVQRGLNRINGWVVAGQYAYYSKGYSERNPSQLKCHIDTIGKRYQIMPPNNTDQATLFVATDGSKVYWAGRDPSDSIKNFVFATNVPGDTDAVFSLGRPLKMKLGRTYNSVIDTTYTLPGHITGMAVQKNANYLFVAHGKLNELHVLYKTTGAVAQTLSYTYPCALATDTSGHLWMHYTQGGTRRTEKFTINANGTLTTTGIILTGLVSPVAMGVSPDNQTLIVADAGSSQQLKGYNNITGVSSWTFGQAGGYLTSALVSNDRFYFSDIKDTLGSFVSFQQDGSFWIGDPGNNRVMHYTASRSFINHLMYVPGTYSCFVNPNNNKRVFAGYLEFEIDYSLPLGHNNGSWKLKRNWGAKVPDEKDEKYHQMRGVTTLSNGRTYATFVHWKLQNPRWEVVELTAADTLRFTGKLVYVRNGILYSQLYPDGSVRWNSRRFLDSSMKWIKQPLTGFDANNNPVWGPDSLLASAPPITPRDPGFNGNTSKLRTGEMTSTNILINFDGGNSSTGSDPYHLGAVKLGDNKWLWRTALATSYEYTGPFPSDGTYDVGNRVVYSGSVATAVGRNIFWGYHGEFWKNSQTNKFNHVYDNGLFVNQFGITGPEVTGREAPPQMAGNVLSPNFIQRNDTIFLYHNDEGHHSGIHRWRITNLNSIQEQVDTVTYTMPGQGILASYYNSPDLNNVHHAGSRIDTNIHINFAGISLPDTTQFSASFTGYVQPQYSERYIFYTNTNKGVRLFVNDSLLIDKPGSNSPAEYGDTSIRLTAGKRYQLRMEVFQNGGIATASLFWKSASQPKVQVPFSRLYPAEMPDYSGGYDLLEHLPYKKIVKSGFYGWTRDSLYNDSTDILRYWWEVRTNKIGYNRLHPDMYMMYVQKDIDTSIVTRNLGNLSGISGWQLNGMVSYDRNQPSEDTVNFTPSGTGGSFMDVLDDQGKTLTRLFWSVNTKSKITRLYINNKPVAAGIDTAMARLFATSQPLSIAMDGDSVSAQYANYPAVTTAKVDATAHSDKPRTLRFYFWTRTKSGLRIINVESMKFSVTSGSALRAANTEMAKPPVLDEEKPGFLIFPNPTKDGVFYLRLSKNKSAPVLVRVTDMSGRQVLNTRLNAATDGYYPIRFNSKPVPGMYIVTINNRYSQKLVVY